MTTGTKRLDRFRQASLQVRGRTRGPIYEILEHAPPVGLGQLPEPAPGDVFFDMEGDPLFEPGRGLEYLFGCWIPDDSPSFRAFWAFNRLEEKRRFEEVIDFILDRRQRYPTMHVYHYAPYEKIALRRLAQQYCTREDEVDRLLRGEVLVDLYAVVRQALTISEDSYSLKKLELFYADRLQRATEVKKGDESIVMFERWTIEKDPNILADIEAYNKDDCYSTYLLREWLLERREEAIKTLGQAFSFRPVKAPNEPCHEVFEPSCKHCVNRQKEEREETRQSEIERALLQGIPPPENDLEFARMCEEERVRYLIAHLIAYYRRESKPVWWKYFERCENFDELQEFDKEALGGLVLHSDVPYKLKPRDRNFVYTYYFPDQHHKMSTGEAHDPRTKQVGTIVELIEDEGLVRVKRGGTLEEAGNQHELIPPGPLPTATQRASVARLGQSYLDGALGRDFPATLDLLAANDPRVFGNPKSLQPETVSAASVSAVIQTLDRSYLFIQGPPGSGKSTTGSQVICDLLIAGKRVAVTSTGHRGIQHLLHKVEADMVKRGKSFTGLYKHGDEDSQFKSRLATPFIASVGSNSDFEGADYQLAGGTSWLFSRKEFIGTFDYIFIDEAGQVSLADAVAVSACANNVVLLGDPSQLAQVSQGVHPPRAATSVLEHLLGDEHTIQPHRGIFLDRSYRMQPAICDFISDAMYDGRLQPAPTTSQHAVSVGGATRSGLWYLPIEHAGNGASSPEEADRIVREILLLREGAVTDSFPLELAGKPRKIEDRDIIVVTPYNAQRRLLQRKFKAAGLNIEVGAVDKFQGQEAPIVFYSMATSSGDDLPRNAEFLFERNRFNVAISRARALSILVCSPRLLDVPCRTPDEMALVNLLCSFAEVAQRDDLAPSREDDRDRPALA